MVKKVSVENMELMNVLKINRQLVLIINQPLKNILPKQVRYSELYSAKKWICFSLDQKAGFGGKPDVQEEEPKKPPVTTSAAPPTPPPKPSPSKFIILFANR
jgi:hypothetical protein